MERAFAPEAERPREARVRLDEGLQAWAELWSLLAALDATLPRLG
jgi:hypothetical protein